MVLRKPYAFFIKIFKPVHILIGFLIAYLIYLDSAVLRFLNSFIAAYSGLMDVAPTKELSNVLLVIIPVVVCLLSMAILGIMVRKKKPVMFYFVNIFLYIGIIIINIYAINFLSVIGSTVVSIKVTKLIHDFVFISIMIEAVTLIMFFTRGFGLNIKKFDFDSDLLSMDISESDREEFEVSLNLDLDETKRKRNRFFRLLKYKYLENKKVVNLTAIGIISFITLIVVVKVVSGINRNVQGNVYYLGGIGIEVKETYILNHDYLGNEITDNYLVIVKCKLNSSASNKVFSKDFELKIDNLTFKSINKYDQYLLDIGKSFDAIDSSSSFADYIFVYEVPKGYEKKNMSFSYSSLGNSLEIKLKPTFIDTNKSSHTYVLGDEVVINGNFGEITLKISDYEISDRFMFEYSYCIKAGDCITSKEYLKPSIDTNFDKVVLRLQTEYANSSTINLNSFFDFFDMFGSIEYCKSDNCYVQDSYFEKLSPMKASSQNNVYVGVNSAISDADTIKLILNIRGSKYEYLLK